MEINRPRLDNESSRTTPVHSWLDVNIRICETEAAFTGRKIHYGPNESDEPHLKRRSGNCWGLLTLGDGGCGGTVIRRTPPPSTPGDESQRGFVAVEEPHDKSRARVLLMVPALGFTCTRYLSDGANWEHIGSAALRDERLSGAAFLLRCCDSRQRLPAVCMCGGCGRRFFFF